MSTIRSTQGIPLAKHSCTRRTILIPLCTTSRDDMYKVYAAGGGGPPPGPSCKRCILPIQEGEPTERIHFAHDPERKYAALNGLYHARCAQPYLSIARILNLNPWGRF